METIFTFCKSLAQAERGGVKACPACGAAKAGNPPPGGGGSYGGGPVGGYGPYTPPPWHGGPAPPPAYEGNLPDPGSVFPGNHPQPPGGHRTSYRNRWRGGSQGGGKPYPQF